VCRPKAFVLEVPHRRPGCLLAEIAGTRGVFLSMTGYMADTVSDMPQGQQPDTLLLDRTHLEAMLSDLFSPADLFTELVDHALYRGEA
jgi:hypothetical protein